MHIHIRVMGKPCLTWEMAGQAVTKTPEGQPTRGSAGRGAVSCSLPVSCTYTYTSIYIYMYTCFYIQTHVHIYREIYLYV